MSSILGSFEQTPPRFPICRLTAWTGQHTSQFAMLSPLFRHCASAFAQHVPDRYVVQQARAQATHPDWIIPGTPYTTVTVNNTYPTGVHQDAGSLVV
jgi:hypothetical protein